MQTFGKLNVTTPSEWEIRFTRTFGAPRPLLWTALTDPAFGPRWLTPPGWTMPVCERDVRPGGRLRCEWRNAAGTMMGLSGEIRAVAPPVRLVHTELFDEDWTGGPAEVTTLLAEGDRAGTTTMILTVRYASRQARDGVLTSPMAEGMESSYAKLDALLADPRQGGV